MEPIEESNAEICSVCFECTDNRTKCNHLVCSDCISDMRIHSMETCPLCRMEFDSICCCCSIETDNKLSCNHIVCIECASTFKSDCDVCIGEQWDGNWGYGDCDNYEDYLNQQRIGGSIYLDDEKDDNDDYHGESI